jgi:uncharacterized protein YdhG (YjbR/CyaY superfamily)
MENNISEKEKQELQEALKELKQNIEKAKPKITKIKEMIKNKQPLTDKQKEIMLRFKRSMDLVQALKEKGFI